METADSLQVETVVSLQVGDGRFPSIEDGRLPSAVSPQVEKYLVDEAEGEDAQERQSNVEGA